MVSRWSWLRASRREEEATNLQAELLAANMSPIRECTPGAVVDVIGTVRSVMVRPINEAPALEVELFDGTGTLYCIWLGRRSIAGIRPGRRMVVHGRLTCSADHPIVFNPRYELKMEHS